MTVSTTKYKRVSFLSPDILKTGSLMGLACMLALPAQAQNTSRQGASRQRPPTLDPTYGLRLPKAAPASRPAIPDAQWIWADTTVDNQEVGLRGSFSLGQPPKSAIIYVTVDDFFTLYVNGRQVDKSAADPKDGNVWQHVHRQDITGLLKPGPNVIALRAFNAGGAAGAVARVEVDGSPVLLTGGAWKMFSHAPLDSQTLPVGWTEAAFNDGGWKPAHIVGPLESNPWAGAGGLIGWPGYDISAPYLAHITLAPKALSDAHNGTGRIVLDERAIGTFEVTLPPSLTPMSRPLSPTDVLVDFGQEVAGRVIISGVPYKAASNKTASNKSVSRDKMGASKADTSEDGFTVVVGTGESAEEATKSPWGGAHTLNVTPGQNANTPYSAFRYARLTFPALPVNETGEGRPFRVRVTLDHKYYPVEYVGAFDCSDEMLTRIWYTGAYTAHLCMQEDIWDAPKRDRARWMGDLHVSGAVINLAFADRFLMEQTMQRLRDDAQGGTPNTDTPRQHVNGIPGYSSAWICGLADFHRHIGDYDYLNKQHDSLISLLEYMRGDLDGRGVFANLHKAWPFVDWAPDFNKDGPRARAATHLFMVKAAREAVFLLYEMGDQAGGKKYASWATSLSEAAQQYLADPKTNTFSDRRQDNAMAIYAGVATKVQTQAIYDKILTPTSPAWQMIATPYYNNYVIYAMSMAGHTNDTLGVLRKYWGGMLDEGATSWWEGYDPRWVKTDFHSHLQADDGTGYFVSLAHGWSAGPTSWLTERVLGVTPTTGGFKNVDITPDLGDLRWAEGDIPTPHGNLHVRVDKQTYGLAARVTVPRGVKATLTVPGNTVYVVGPRTMTLASPDKPLPKPL